MSVALARQAPYPVRTAQRRCGKCGKLVSRSAYACRRCGKSQRVRPRIIWLGLGGCLMAGMFAVASAGAIRTPARPMETAASMPVPVGVAASARAPAPAAQAGLARRMSATDLWMAYSRDAAGSDRSFRDQPVLVTGTIRSIDRDFGGRLLVRFNTGDAFETVNATMASRDNPTVIGTAKGRTLSLLCEGRGMLMGAPLLGGCSVK
ncbi:MAG TPA: hypothetical protein VFG23_11655 [Polyangia bacterium]|nr:hypothetical protein [Polyangia bacterium]